MNFLYFALIDAAYTVVVLAWIGLFAQSNTLENKWVRRTLKVSIGVFAIITAYLYYLTINWGI